jgi:hypothetical protein
MDIDALDGLETLDPALDPPLDPESIDLAHPAYLAPDLAHDLVPIDAPALNYPSTYYLGHRQIAVQGSQYQISHSN